MHLHVKRFFRAGQARERDSSSSGLCALPRTHARNSWRCNTLTARGIGSPFDEGQWTLSFYRRERLCWGIPPHFQLRTRLSRSSRLPFSLSCRRVWLSVRARIRLFCSQMFFIVHFPPPTQGFSTQSQKWKMNLFGCLPSQRRENRRNGVLNVCAFWFCYATVHALNLQWFSPLFWRSACKYQTPTISTNVKLLSGSHVIINTAMLLK